MSNHHAWASPQFRAPVALAQDLVLRHLQTHVDIEKVRALRGHIDLGMHCALDPLFPVHEKKETRWASLSLSNIGARSSGRFGLSQCVSA
ncbi:MAG: hypothetical protein K0Q43_1612 [Ramlibacter sp.]|jgi:hypothetical protein|nr:hypothetical protein [Ramlibacter sp.]